MSVKEFIVVMLVSISLMILGFVWGLDAKDRSFKSDALSDLQAARSQLAADQAALSTERARFLDCVSKLSDAVNNLSPKGNMNQ